MSPEADAIGEDIKKRIGEDRIGKDRISREGKPFSSLVKGIPNPKEEERKSREKLKEQAKQLGVKND
jgi:hypothetical protein